MIHFINTIVKTVNIIHKSIFDHREFVNFWGQIQIDNRGIFNPTNKMCLPIPVASLSKA
jgi:hypothetical protein